MKIPYDRLIFKPASSLLLIGLSIISFASTPNAAKASEQALPDAGHLVFSGSVALSNLMTYWTQAFAEQNPSITVTIADPGSITGIDTLINGTADMVLTSTNISDKQKQAFEQRYGYPPRIIPVAKDALAVYINALNPLKDISFQELDAVYSETLRCGMPKPIRTWAELGIKGALAKRWIAVYGLTVETGATDLFRQTALCGGDFNQYFQALAGPAAVQDALISDISGIGFSSSTMRSAGMRALAVAPNKNAAAILPVADTIRSSAYPLSRTLAIVVNYPIAKPFTPVMQAFIDFVLSVEGQSVVDNAGYVSLP
ncbi:MAG: phosphate transport system substrate-binding protein [Methyloprofundus sp.]|nr:MAG: phosphate transport system substrate-binding protein [Methyloprofundus sp.]